MDNVQRLSELLARAPKSIEIIPGDGHEWLELVPENEHTPFLFVEENLGVPEKILYGSYMLSIKILGEPRNSIQTPDSRKTASILTRVILLANPAHQSVLNIRRTILFDTNLEIDVTILENELVFIASLLSVKHCAKVSALWNYRRVLLRSIVSGESTESGIAGFQNLSFTDDAFLSTIHISAASLRSELDLVARACDIYPRNYYAWHHRTLCIRTCAAGARAQRISSPFTSESELKPGTHARQILDLESLLMDEFAATKRWVEQHVSDYSAVDHLCHVVEALESLVLNTDTADDHDYAGECRQHALSLTKLYPTHETLWLYLRKMLAFRSIREKGETTQNQFPGEADIVAKIVLMAARQRCENSDVTDPEIHVGARHALRFLLWRAQTTGGQFTKEQLPNLTCIHFTSTKARCHVELLRHISSIA
ncbi:hypothetical protein EW145_g3003 [Phellinidium pouzarii]|uniref:Protein geranylgeranyltransferase type II n=1 Tax=Phellinidium pouzarii TaxID=167371 RepID=A0A4S4L970_9AGAM|nr:hypothetical protein EW145_g3003 [Phellinidium pouzarii]